MFFSLLTSRGSQSYQSICHIPSDTSFHHAPFLVSFMVCIFLFLSGRNWWWWRAPPAEEGVRSALCSQLSGQPSLPFYLRVRSRRLHPAAEWGLLHTSSITPCRWLTAIAAPHRTPSARGLSQGPHLFSTGSEWWYFCPLCHTQNTRKHKTWSCLSATSESEPLPVLLCPI